MCSSDLGAMCLLHELVACDARELRCRVVSHADAAHPLRSHGALPAVAGIELASQAMALHGALNLREGVIGRPGYIASARDVRLHVPRLDEVAGELLVEAENLAGNERQVAYRFAVREEEGQPLVEGRVTVVLDTALPA